MSNVLNAYGIPTRFLDQARSRVSAIKIEHEPMTLRRLWEVTWLTTSAITIAFAVTIGLGYGIPYAKMLLYGL